MKATIEILDDNELRKHVYALIEGQVRKILREEGSKIVKKVVDHDLNNFKLQEERIDRVIEKTVDKYIRNESFYNPGESFKNSFKKLVEDEVRSCLRDKIVALELR